MRTVAQDSGQVAVRVACVAFGIAFLTAIATGASEVTALARGAIAAVATRILCPLLLAPVYDALRRTEPSDSATDEGATGDAR